MAKSKKAKTKSKTKAADAIKSMAMSPMVQEVVAAALVATAAALKDTKKARAMAEDAGDQLQSLAKEGQEKGKALWALALDVAKRAGDIIQEKPKAAKKAKKAVAAKPVKAARAPAKRAPAKRAPARRPATRKAPVKKA